MKSNYEIRFRTNKETFQLVNDLRKKIAPELVLSSFKEGVFLLGLSDLQLQIAKNNPQILINLLKRK